MKKIYMTLAAFLLFLIGSIGGANEAKANFECWGGASRCVDVTMPYGYQYASSPTIYLYKGETVSYDFETGSTSVYHVAYAVHDSLGIKVTPWRYAAQKGGSSGYTFTVPYTGSYYLLAGCAGGDQTRCTGGGTLRYP